MRERFPRSAALFDRALRVSPGGVHSPVRGFGQVGGTPLFIERATGCTLYDADANAYTDYCMAFGPLILGHGDPDVADALHAALDDGWSYGAAETWSLELAELISGRIPWAEQIRFVNSGTEAVMSALRLARAVTGRDRILKFAGCYHGHTDALLIAAGSGLAGQPSSAGVPAAVAADTLVVPLDDSDALDSAFRAHGDELAAAIIEPLPANHGLLPQRPEFLRQLRELCNKFGAQLIFDEVITGFRIAFGGMAEACGIEPDIVTYGKIVGGGLPVGAVASSTTRMAQFAPLGPVYQAGTLSANPLAMRAGLATLEKLANGAVYQRLDALGTPLDAHPSMQRRGSLFWLGPADADASPRRPDQIPSAHADRYPELFRHLLSRGIYFPPSGVEICFLSDAHSPGDVEALLAALESFDSEGL